MFGRDIAGADLDQQFGKPLSAQRRKVLRVQCLLGRHQLRCPFLVRPIVFFCGLFRTARIRSAAGNSGPGSSPRALRAPRCSALRVRPSTRATCSRWETAERRSVASNLWSDRFNVAIRSGFVSQGAAPGELDYCGPGLAVLIEPEEAVVVRTRDPLALIEDPLHPPPVLASKPA